MHHRTDTRTLSASMALDLLARNRGYFLDVRSEGEFVTAAIPGFSNGPILRDHERHEVGLCYRLRGQAAAIELGYQLVGPTHRERVERWLDGSEPEQPVILCCWRGGLRSQIASDWIRESGREVGRIEGGYKAMRHEFLKILNDPPALKVIAGLTGAGKTRLLDALPFPEKLNIEDLAAHRGSSFGRFWQRRQPTQTNFENGIAFGLWPCRKPVLVEDESKVIGSVHLPDAFHAALMRSPVIFLEASLADRSAALYEEYVAQVLAEGVPAEELEASLIANTRKLQRRLGGLLTSQIVGQIQSAFSSTDREAHSRWISTLLTEYYDQRYRYAQQVHATRPVEFRGNYEECQQWILNQYA